MLATTTATTTTTTQTTVSFDQKTLSLTRTVLVELLVQVFFQLSTTETAPIVTTRTTALEAVSTKSFDFLIKFLYRVPLQPQHWQLLVRAIVPRYQQS